MNRAESLHLLLTREQVVTDLFYIKYLSRYPELAEHFIGVDMDQQAVLLRMALSVVHQYEEHRYLAAEQYLLVLGRKHARRNIPQDLYPEWRDCMLDTLEQVHGDDWSGGLEAEWTAAIETAIEVIRRGYSDFGLPASSPESLSS
jgi:hemoglobin-like flavoprotein